MTCLTQHTSITKLPKNMNLTSVYLMLRDYVFAKYTLRQLCFRKFCSNVAMATASNPSHHC